MAEAQEVDVEQVMERIREAVRRRRSAEQSPTSERMSVSDNGSAAPDFGHLQSVGDVRKVAVTSHRRLLGALIVAVKKILLKLLTPMLEQQAAYNAAVVRAIADTENRMHSLERRRGQVLDAAIDAITDRIAALERSREQLDALERSREQLDAGVADLRKQLRDESARVRGEVFARVVEDVSARHAELRTEIVTAAADLRRDLEIHVESARRTTVRISGMSERLAASERRWRRLVHALQAGPTPGALSDPAAADTPAPRLAELEPEFDYAGFEDRFRGTEEDIKERQRIYVPCFEGASNVVDIGCGRGEFLELLREHGIEAQGVDLDLDMVLLCRDKELDVIREDAFAYLARHADDSLGGVFSAQLIEHLYPRRIIELVKLCHRKLVRGGVLVLETPNPACLTVFADSFYRDFSHIQPIHPDTMKFLFEATGFRQLEVKPLAPVDPAMRVPPLQSADPAVASFNQGIERLNALLFGFQDYAIVGRK